MNRWRYAVAALSVFSVLAGSAGVAATTKKAPAKKATKPAKSAKPTKPVTQGTSQLKGDQAVFGKEYTIGKSSPMNVLLKSAEYTTTPLRLGNSLIVPTGSQKLLILHYSLHNPQHGGALVRFDNFVITAVDSASVNYEFTGQVGAESNHQDLEMNLKPGQKVDAYACFLLPDKCEIAKVIYKTGNDPILRYDFTGKAKPLAAPFADPSDKTGTTALEKVPAATGTAYPTGQFLFTLDKAAFQTEKIGDSDLEEGSRFLVFSATMKNVSPGKPLLRFDTYRLSLHDADGAEVDWNQTLLSGSRNASLETTMEPDQEIKGRFFYPIPNDLKLKDLTVREGSDGRAFVYDLSGVQ